jgi:uncharacterized protein
MNNRDIYLARDPLFKELYNNPQARLMTADDLISSMDELGIDKSVILNIGWASEELCKETNDYILDTVARYGKRIWGFCAVDVESPDVALKELERCFENGIKGVGELRPSPGWFRNRVGLKSLLQYLIERQLILLTHASEPVGHIYPGKGNITPEVLFPFISDYPDLRLVCAHWGGGLPFYSLMPEVKKVLKNVYFDTAASPYLYNPQIYLQIFELIGSNRVLFGSDFPLLSPRRLLREIQALSMSEDDLNNMLYRNAQTLLG